MEDKTSEAYKTAANAMIASLLEELETFITSFGGMIKEIVITFYKSGGGRKKRTTDSNSLVDYEIIVQSENTPTAIATQTLSSDVATGVQTSQADTLAPGVTVTTEAATSEDTVESAAGTFVIL